MKAMKFLVSFLITSMLFTISGCSDDVEKALIPPTSEDAIFSVSYDSENPNKVHFKGEPAVPTWYTHWSFGDNTSFDEGLETSKVYLKKGEYDVEFKIFTDGGTASSTQTVSIESDFQGPNIIRNGDFVNGNEYWTVLPISDGVNVSLDNENAQWTGGGWGQVGIYQPVNVLANNLYQITMDIKGSGLSDSWFEVYIGMEPPVPGQDYTDGGIRMGLNTWEGCGSEPFEGAFSEISCVGSGATFEFPTEGVAYLVIRGGGANYGDTGVTIDNVAIRSLESTDPPTFPDLDAPNADFDISTDDLTATFTNTSTNATSYIWDFGDNTGTSTEENPSYAYTQVGTYTVTLTAVSGDETSVITKEVTVSQTMASDSLQNGDFSDDSVWTIIPQNNSGNGSLIIADGVAVFDEAIDVASGSWGQEAHMGMYQAVIAEAGDYQFDMDITTNGIDEVWFEVWVGTSKPIEGVEYNADSGANKVLSFNAWDCGDTNKTYSGKMAAASCQGTNGSINLEAGTYYILIRSGGFTFGDGGIIIDNVTMEEKVVSASPVAEFTATTADLTATFSNTSTNATSYTWDFGDGTGTSNDENPVYTYSESGTYVVKLTATNDDGSDEVTSEVTVTTAAVAPVAGFTVNTSDLTATFTNTSTDATSYTWDFGDGTGTSNDENPVYTYPAEGVYNVSLTASNDDQSDEYTYEVSVTVQAADNLISNGGFDDGSGWTIVNHYEAANTNGLVTFENGVAKFDETTNADWKHMGIYTVVNLEPGTYQFEMEMAYADISDVWGEVYVGTAVPADGSDYNGDQQVLKAYNAWDCGDIKTYSGLATESGCDTSDNPGQFEITNAGTYYILFRTGGGTYGTNGITIDNMSLIKTN